MQTEDEGLAGAGIPCTLGGKAGGGLRVKT